MSGAGPIPAAPDAAVEARRLHVRGVVQGVGFRPFVFRLAHRHALCGWVRNGPDGVDIHVEGAPEDLRAFTHELAAHPPPAARVVELDAAPAVREGYTAFSIRDTVTEESPTARISPDLAACDACLAECADPEDRRYGYPYVNCTHCGPRYSIVTALPYDRSHTTMREWPMCAACRAEYDDPLDRRFHAQPTACPACGPHYVLHAGGTPGPRGDAAVEEAARLLRAGRVLAVKGLGGYHLVCDACDAAAVRALRTRKYRKEKPFALMVPDVATARSFARVSAEEERLLFSPARPIVLLAARDGAARLAPEVAPGNGERGVMLPYTPLHALLFERGAPRILVMTSGNRSSEPIAYQDEAAFERLGGIADAFLAGERRIARRVDDAVVRRGPLGPMVLRRARGYAPGVVASFPASRPVLALGADLKSAVTLVVGGEAFMGQHVGDLAHYDIEEALRQTVDDLTSMYGVRREELLVVHDAHPGYRSTALAATFPGERRAVQHHRAHVASVLAERDAWDSAVIGFAFDGTGYGDDGSVWGGEVFAGSLRGGLARVASLHPARLPGGDAAARAPVQAAAGFLASVPGLPDLAAAPFFFPSRFRTALRLVEQDVRSFPTTSVGRLFDAAAALVGFTRTMTYEGQAAIWLEQLARAAPPVDPYPFPGLDYRPLLSAVVTDRLRGRPLPEVARAFHAGVARQVVALGSELARRYDTDTLVLSGGVFQNVLLLEEMKGFRDRTRPLLRLWTNREVPTNDGGLSLGQAALAVAGHR